MSTIYLSDILDAYLTTNDMEKREIVFELDEQDIKEPIDADNYIWD